MFRVARISLLLLVCLLSWQATSAQETKTQPVARLITRFAPTTATTNTATPVTSPTLAEANDIERRAFEQTNAARVQHGLPALAWDAAVCRMARTHSESMSRLNYFAHVTPEGLRLRDRARAAGILAFTVIGENIAYNQGYEDPGAFAVERWMASEKHRANILSNEFRAMAIGTYVAPDGSVFLTQTFITR